VPTGADPGPGGLAHPGGPARADGLADARPATDAPPAADALPASHAEPAVAAAPTDDAGAADVAALAARRAAVLERISLHCALVGRDPDEVTLVAVSKTVPVERLRAAVAAGLDLLGENRVQEAEAKRSVLVGARWHLIGRLQANKARRALETFDAIESVDSLSLAVRLDRLVRELRGSPPSGPVDEVQRFPVLLEVNVDADPAKAGFTPGALEASLPDLAELGALRLEGLMTVGRLVDDPEAARPTFRALRGLGERLRSRAGTLGPALSMGMTDDYAIAVEEGATIVRVGRAIFGERPA
jgi:pyridoxal phosphate enzyme (YggS family)